jgi:putative colanic acid biosynthesis acetyltransferase WcaF
MGAWRAWLWSLFGARLGRVRPHGSARLTAPWLLKAGRDVYIDRWVYLYNTYGIELGDRVIISFGAVLCTPTHDYNDPSYPLTGRKIVVEDDVWIAAQAFIAPGVRIGRGAIIGARAVVYKDVPPWAVVAGNPAQVIKYRNLSEQPAPAAASVS